MTTEGEKVAEIVSTAGQDTLRRFKYQLEYVALCWLEALGTETVIISELSEDLEIASAEVGNERIQVKTLQVGSWSIVDLSSEGTPVLQRFLKQHSQDQALRFAFVTNAGPQISLARIRDAIAANHAGSDLSAQEKTYLKQAVNSLAKRLGTSKSNCQSLLLAIDFRVPFSGLDELRLRMREKIALIAEERFNVVVDQPHLDRIYTLLLGEVFERSSSELVSVRTLTSDILAEIFQRELAAVDLGGKVNQAELTKTLQQFLGGLPGKETFAQPPQVIAASALTASQIDELGRLQALLADPNAYSLIRVKVEDRLRLARLLELAGDASSAESELGTALSECDDDLVFANAMKAVANFLARANPKSTLLLPYLDRYVQVALDGPSVLWIEASHVFTYVCAAHGLCNYVKSVLKNLEGKSADKMDSVERLHWQEAMAVLYLIEKRVDEAVAQFRELLENIASEPTYDHERLRTILEVSTPALEGHPEFDGLFKNFAAYYESKEAWGARADLYKARAVSLRSKGDYREAIFHLYVAAEGYGRVASKRGMFLTRYAIADCYRADGKLLSSLRETLSLCMVCDRHGVRDLALAALGNGASVAFELGLSLDAVVLLLTHARMASAFHDDESLDWAVNSIDIACAQLAAQSDPKAFDLAAKLVDETFRDDELADWLSLLRAAGFATDGEWELRVEAEETTIHDVLRSIRRGIQDQRVKGLSGSQTELAVSFDGLTVAGTWSEEPGLRMLVLGILSWFESLEPLRVLFQEVADNLHIYVSDFETANWSTTVYSSVKDLGAGEMVTVLSGMNGDRSPRGFIVLPSAVYDATREQLGTHELPALHQLVMNLRGLYLGDSQQVSSKRYVDEVLRPNEYAVRSVLPIGSSFFQLGGFVLES